MANQINVASQPQPHASAYGVYMKSMSIMQSTKLRAECLDPVQPANPSCSSAHCSRPSLAVSNHTPHHYVLYIPTYITYITTYTTCIGDAFLAMRTK